MAMYMYRLSAGACPRARASERARVKECVLGYACRGEELDARGLTDRGGVCNRIEQAISRADI